MTESEISEEDIPDVPKWVLGIVLAVRMIGGLVIAAGALYVVSLFTQIPFYPQIESVTITRELLVWIGAVAVIEFVVIGVFFYPLVYSSWLVASLFYKPLRDSLIEEWNKDRGNETA